MAGVVVTKTWLLDTAIATVDVPAAIAFRESTAGGGWTFFGNAQTAVAGQWGLLFFKLVSS